MIYVYNFFFVVVFGLYILMYIFYLPQNEDITKIYKFHCYHFIRQFSGWYFDLFYCNLNLGKSFLYFKGLFPQIKGRDLIFEYSSEIQSWKKFRIKVIHWKAWCYCVVWLTYGSKDQNDVSRRS